MMQYPKRPTHFAYKFCRLLTKVVAAQEIGPDGCWLLAVVAHQEDAKRYSGPVTFYNGQLLSPAGFNSEESLVRVRARCMEFGWLHYERGAKRKPGKYWVTIPEGIDVADGPIDEGLPEEYTRKNRGESAGESAVVDKFQAANLRGKAKGKPRESAGPSTLSLSLPLNTPLPPVGGNGVSEKRGSGKPKPARQLSKADLRDTGIVLDWLRRRASKLNLNADDYEIQQRALAAAELAGRADKAGYFEACLRNQKWALLSDADLSRAKRRLADHFAGSMPDVAKELAGAMAAPNFVSGEGFDDE